MGANRTSMSKTFSISLLDFAMGGELLELQLLYITPGQIKAILEALQGMVQNIIHGQGSYYDMVQYTVQQINTLMAAYEENTVCCRVCPGLTDAQIHEFIRLLDEETMGAEISTTATLEPGAVISNQLRRYLHHVHNHYIFAAELEPALRLNWTDVLHELHIPEDAISYE
jgi:hypothetical protein